MSSVTNEAFARVKIDQLLRDAGWKLTDGRSVRFEYPLGDGGKVGLRLVRPSGAGRLAVLEAKSTSVNLSAGEAQARRYAEQLDVPRIFLSNGEEVWFSDKAPGRPFSPGRDRVQPGRPRSGARPPAAIRRNPLDVPIDPRIAGGGGRLYQTACIERPLPRDRRRAPEDCSVEMATGTGKTRVAAALDQAPVRGAIG